MGVGCGVVAPSILDSVQQATEPAVHSVDSVLSCNESKVDRNTHGDVYFEFKVEPLADLKGVGNAAATPHQGLYIFSPLSWGFGGADVPILIDCGATVSLLDMKIYMLIPETSRPPLQETEARVSFADGSVQKCNGEICLPLKIGDTWHDIFFLVGRYSDSAILGMRDLQKLGISIDFEGMVVVKEDQWIPTCDPMGRWVSRQATVKKATVVPARTQCVVEVQVAERPVPGLQYNSPAYLLEP